MRKLISERCGEKSVYSTLLGSVAGDMRIKLTNTGKQDKRHTFNSFLTLHTQGCPRHKKTPKCTKMPLDGGREGRGVLRKTQRLYQSSGTLLKKERVRLVRSLSETRTHRVPECGLRSLLSSVAGIKYWCHPQWAGLATRISLIR